MAEAGASVIRETDAEAVRLASTLLRTARHGAIAVLDPSSGAPLASRVGVATDLDGTPLVLVSMLAAHTRALIADSRCSLLLGDTGKGDPLAHPRISLACRAERLDKGSPAQLRAERRYLNRNPKAKLYVGLGDFSFFRLEIGGASLNGGFGKAYSLDRSDLVVDGPVTDGLVAGEQSALDHMNSDHGPAIDLYASQFAKATGTGWVLTGLDADGMDLANGDESRRVFYPSALRSADDLRRVLVDMARTARMQAAGKA